MGHKGRQGLTRKAQPGRNRSKIVSKFTSTQNVDKQMKTSLKAKGHQPRRNARAPRTVDVAKRAKLAREPSPAEFAVAAAAADGAVLGSGRRRLRLRGRRAAHGRRPERREQPGLPARR